MPAGEVSGLLRAGVLQDVTMLLAGAGARGPQVGDDGEAVRALCARLGAGVFDCPAPRSRSGEWEEDEIEGQLDGVLAAAGRVDVAVVDAGGLYATDVDGPVAGDEVERGRLRRCVEGSWSVTRAVFGRAFIPGGDGGRIVYIAPRPGAGAHAEAATAGLENLARTLSIEWARRRVTPVTIAPGEGTAAGEVAALVAYLASPAGAYFSGCLLDLRGAAASR